VLYREPKLLKVDLPQFVEDSADRFSALP